MSAFSDSHVAKILAGRRAIGRAPFPGVPEVEVGIRLLTEREVDEARFDAQVYLGERARKLGLELDRVVKVEPDLLDSEYQRQVVLRSIVTADSDPAKPTPFFGSVLQVRELDSVTVNQLWSLYVDWSDAIDPRIGLSEEQIDALLEQLKKGRNERVLLGHLRPDTLASLVRTLARRLPSSPGGRSDTSES